MIVCIDFLSRRTLWRMLMVCVGMSGVKASNPVDADQALVQALAASTADVAAYEDELLQRTLAESQHGSFSFEGEEVDRETAAAIAASLSPQATGDDDLFAVMRTSQRAEEERQRVLQEEEAAFAAVLAASALEAGLSPGADHAAPAQPHDPYAEERGIQAEQKYAFAKGALIDLARDATQVVADIETARAILTPAREALEAAQGVLENNQGRLRSAEGNPRLQAAVAASLAEVQGLEGEYTALERDLGREIKIMEARLGQIARLQAEHQATLAGFVSD